MKQLISHRFVFALLLISGFAFGQQSYAQAVDKDKKTMIRIKITEKKDGKIKNIEKKYEVATMPEEEQKKFIDKAIDSLNIPKENQQNLTITIDDGEESFERTKKSRHTPGDRFDDHEAMAFNWADDFADHLDSEKFRSHMRNFEREFRPKARIVMKDMEHLGNRMGDFWSGEIAKPSTVRGLNVYANNPDNGILNLRFQAPQKGDVSISITDTRGKEVGKKEIKDFCGDFLGQVEIKKNTKGTLFVTVVQHEDGATRRVVIP